jgi:hypothetical protein
MTWPVPVWKAGGWTVAAILAWLVWHGYRQHRRRKEVRERWTAAATAGSGWTTTRMNRTIHDSQPEPHRSQHVNRTRPA